MRIAYIVYRFPCLSESFVLDQIIGMVEAGHEVTIFADAGGNSDPVDPRIHAFGLLDRTYYLPRHSTSRPALLLHAAATQFRHPSAASTLRKRRALRPTQLIRSLARLHRFSMSGLGPFDIVHCQFGCIARKYWSARWLWNAKLVVSFRGHDFSSLPLRLGPDIFDELFAEATAVVPVCHYAKRRLAELGCPHEKMVVHPSGTNVEEFTFARRTAPGADEPIRLLSVARLEESKGLDDALRAVALLVHERKINLRYSVVGNGSAQGDLARLTDELQLNDRVQFLGPQSRPRVQELMQAHHLFVLPSVTAEDGGQEGIPGSVREAMATGLPVVSTLHSGIPELVTDGDSGFLVPEHDVHALADRLEHLARHPEAWATMGERGRQRVEECYEIHRLNRRLDGLYRHIAAGGRPIDFAVPTADAERRPRAIAPSFLTTA